MGAGLLFRAGPGRSGARKERWEVGGSLRVFGVLPSAAGSQGRLDSNLRSVFKFVCA